MTQIGRSNPGQRIPLPDGGAIELAWGAATEVGHRRQVNEDSLLAAPPLLDDDGGQRGDLADDPKLLPGAPTARIVLEAELVAAEGRDSGPESPGRVGVPCELANEAQDVDRKLAAAAQVALKSDPVGRFAVGGRSGDQQEGDPLEVGVGRELLDRHASVGETAARRIEPHDAGRAGDHAGEAGADVRGDRPIEPVGAPVEAMTEGAKVHPRRIPENDCQDPGRELEDGSWKLDLTMMTRALSFNHRNEWRFKMNIRHPYWFAFEDWRFDKHGFPHEPR